MIQTLLEFNYPFFICMAFLLLFILTNHNFNRSINHLFLTILALLTIVVISDNIEYIQNMRVGFIPLRKIMQAVSNVLRPLSIYFVILLFKRESSLKLKHLLLIPTGINFVTNILGLFTDLVVKFDSFGRIHNGPLFYVTTATAIFYVCLMLFFALENFSRKNYMEFSVMFLVFAAIVFGIFIKTAYGYCFVLNCINIISLTYIYLYMNVQKYKRDDLTNVLNRRSFVLDEERLGNELKAIISLDLNNLKVLNDTKGHKEGDRALITLAKVVNSCLIYGTELYRTGGDEFEIICSKKASALELEKMILDIRMKMDDTDYSCAVGIGYAEKGLTPEQIRAEADAKMYEEKARMKGGYQNIR